VMGVRGVRLTTLLHPVPTLRMGGVMSLLPLYACMVWSGSNLPFLSSSAEPPK
jgi:hypothetical protein